MEAAATVEKALDVLYHLHGSGSSQGVSEIGRALELPKSTTHRLLAALVRRGLVEQDLRGRYRPGIALVALGLGVLEREPVVAVARPVLETQSEELGETIFLAVARAGRIVILDKQEGPGFLRASPRVGATLPVHATGIGKLYLAFAPEAVEIPPHELDRYTDQTLTSRAALEAELSRVREAGYAENQEEWIPGLTGIAAPILLADRMLGAIAVSGPRQHFDASHRERFADAIVAAAKTITARLEGNGYVSQ